jgi:DNA-binding SARP family transcriptional activator
VGIEVLGPLRIDGGDVSLQRRDQVVLSALIVRAGEVVSADRIAEALWPDIPPPTWPKVIQGSVLRLRRTFGASLIETAPGGYRLVVSGEDLDSQRFEELVERGRLLSAAGEFDRAAVAFGRALELWRGRPFELVDSWPPGQIAAAQLEESFRIAEESIVDARLHLGEHRDVVPVAEALAAEQPLREHRWALLALALYRCGRQADALRAIKRARHTLIEQLGLEPGSELVELEAAILRQDASLLAPPEPPAIAEHCPYKGLAPYDVDDTDTFFGRDEEIAACLDRLAESPLLIVTGPSGTGKSSLLRAGLVPALRERGQAVAVFTPGSDPDAAMAGALAACAGTPVLVVDQFEELFTSGGGSSVEVGEFCARLADYAADRAPVVIAVRANHVASLAADPSFARLAERGMHLVTTLSGDSLREAIEGPARQAGLRLEHGLVDLLVRDCEGAPGALPLLSHALAETWQRRDGRVLTVEGYRATGEIRGAVARTADRLYESLPPDQRPKLRSLLLRLVSPTPDGEPTRNRVVTRTLGDDPDRARVIGLLVRARLVTADDDTVELAHEALARAWPRLRSWLDEDAGGLRLLRHLSAAAEGWESLGRPDAELYRGARLEAVSEWRAATNPDLTDEELAFLEASTSAAESERRRAAEQARAGARQRRRQRFAVAGVALLLVVAATGGVVAYQQRQATHRGQREAEVRALATTSQALRSAQPDLAALLAVESHSMDPSAATESAVFSTFTAAPGLRRTTRTDIDLGQSRVSGSYLPDGDRIALVDGYGAVHLVDLTDGAHEPLAALNAESPGNSVLATSADGHFAAVLYRDRREAPSLLTVWDLRTGKQRFEPVNLPARPSSVAISSDGTLLAVSGSGQQPTEVRDGSSGELTTTVAPVSTATDVSNAMARTSVAFAPDGQLAIGSSAGPIRFIDPTTGDELKRLDGPARTSDLALRFVEDGTILVTVGTGGLISFNLVTGRSLTTVAHGPSTCNGPVHSARLDAVICETAGHVAAYGYLGAAVDIPNHVDTGAVCGLIVSSDGRTLAELSSCRNGDGATIREWRLDGGGAVSHAAQAQPTDFHIVQRYGFDGDSSALVAWTSTSIDVPDDAMAVIDPTTGEVVEEFPGIYGLDPTDNPDVMLSLLTEHSIATYDVVGRTPIDELEVGFVLGGWDYWGTMVAIAGGAEGDDVNYPIVQVRIVEFDGEPSLGPLIDGTGSFEVVNFGLDEDDLLLAVELDGGDQYRIEHRDTVTGEVVGEPAIGYRDFATEGDVTVFATTDGRLVQVDSDTWRPIGFPFGNAQPDDWLLLDDRGQRLAAVGGASLVAEARVPDSLRLYDVAARTQLGDTIQLGDLDAGFAGAAFRPDGLELAVDTAQGIVVWSLDPIRWVQAACDVAGRNLTQAEWDQYIGDLAPYRATCPQFAST